MVAIIVAINIFLLGLLASFQPCLFPILPSFLAFLTNKEDSKINGLVAGILVTLGIMTVFIIMVFIFQGLRGFLSINFLKFRTGQGIILMVLGVIILLQLSVNWNFLNKLNSKASGVLDRIENPFFLSYMIGLLFSLLAAPCAIIIFATVLFTVISEPIMVGILLMMIFSIGIGVPFLVIGGFVPSLKNHFLDNQQLYRQYLSIVASVLIIGVGGFLTLDGLKII